jgi:hypothetical protein
MKRLAILALCGCGSSTELTLDLRVPADRHLLAAVSRLVLTAERDQRVVAQASFSSGADRLAFSVTHGPGTVITLDGLTASSDVIGRGRTCAVDFEGGGMHAPLYFAPTNFFAPTAGAPAATRVDPVALTIGDAVLIAGGQQMGAALATVESFATGGATFAPAPGLSTARQGAAAVELPGGFALVAGGQNGDGVLGDAEIWNDAQKQFTPLSSSLLGKRVGHRVVALPDGSALVTGGSDGENALATTAFVRVQPDGTALVGAGPPLHDARRAHAAVVAIGAPVAIGGYGTDGKALATIEALNPAATTAAMPIAMLQFARAEVTASVLGDGSILVVGGLDDKGVLRADAELFNPIYQTTTIYPLGFARRGHTATLLADGRVLIAGGFGADGQPLASVELFAPGYGFLSERPLGTPRAGHVAVPLCDGTVLVVGGAPGAEIYTPPSS